MTAKNDSLDIYADASYDVNYTFCGYSFLILKNQKTIHNFSGLALANGSFEAEMFAVIRALEYLCNTRKPKTLKQLKIRVFVDCRGIIQKVKAKKYGDCLFKYLNSLRGHFKTSEIVWVKGHSGNNLNSLVDKQARQILRKYIEPITYL